MILIIDNYDSFTHNLAHLVAVERMEYVVVQNDQISIDEIRSLQPAGILLAPGPVRPEDAGVSPEVVRQFEKTTTLLGVCLGHQLIAQRYGADIVHADYLVHGKTSIIRHDEQGIFAGITQDIAVTRYHSLVVDSSTLPDDLTPTAWTTGDTLMGIRHRTLPIEGVQFHPESILTEFGQQMITNWISSIHHD